MQNGEVRKPYVSQPRKLRLDPCAKGRGLVMQFVEFLWGWEERLLEGRVPFLINLV